jgi:hypothetical protein
MFTALNHPKPPWLCHVVKPYKRTLMSKSTQVLGFLVLAPLMPSPCLLASCRFALSCTWVLHGESCEGVECHASLWDIHSPCLVASCHFASFYTWTPSSMKHQLCCPMWIHHTSTCPHQMVLWWIPHKGHVTHPHHKKVGGEDHEDFKRMKPMKTFLVISFVPTSLVFQHERNQGQVLYIASSLLWLLHLFHGNFKMTSFKAIHTSTPYQSSPNKGGLAFGKGCKCINK